MSAAQPIPIRSLSNALLLEPTRPGPISSKELEDPETPGVLRQGIRAGVDYVVWPDALWQRMTALYGSTNSTSSAFRRRLVRKQVPRLHAQPAATTAAAVAAEDAGTGAAAAAATEAPGQRSGAMTGNEGAASGNGSASGSTDSETGDGAAPAAAVTPAPASAPAPAPASPAADGGAPVSDTGAAADAVASDPGSSDDAGTGDAPGGAGLGATAGANTAVVATTSATIHVQSTAAAEDGPGEAKASGGASDDAPTGVGLESARRGSMRLCSDPAMLEVELYPPVLHVLLCSLKGRPVANSAFPIIVRCVQCPASCTPPRAVLLRCDMLNGALAGGPLCARGCGWCRVAVVLAVV